MSEPRRQILDSAMSNLDAGSLGRIARDVGNRDVSEGVGDEIDRGLIMTRLLREQGYELVKVHDARCGWGHPGIECTCIYRRAQRTGG
jgi:hypothetical protein